MKCAVMGCPNTGTVLVRGSVPIEEQTVEIETKICRPHGRAFSQPLDVSVEEKP